MCTFIATDNLAVILKIPGHNEKCSSIQIERVLSGAWLDSEVIVTLKKRSINLACNIMSFYS